MSHTVTSTTDQRPDTTNPDLFQTSNDAVEVDSFAQIRISQTIAVLLHNICSDPTSKTGCDCALAKISKFYIATVLQYLLTSDTSNFQDIIKITPPGLTPHIGDNKLPDFQKLWDSVKAQEKK